MRRYSHLITGALALMSVAATPMVRAQFTPVPLTPDSFVYDSVVEQTAPQPFTPATTASMDGGTNNTGNTWYAQGYNLDAPETGLPPAGSTVTSESLPDHQYTFAPAYTANNALLLDNAVPSGTLTLTSPTAFSMLSFLASSGNGAVVVAYTLRFADGTTESGTFTSPDWFNADPTAITANGRINAVTGAFANVDSGNPRLYSIDVPVTNTGSPISAIDLSFSSGGANGHAAVFAVSGSTGAEFQPITVTGFNQDMVFEATAPRPEPLNATTASMDAGAGNTGFTWYERGYNVNAPETGLPAPGSTLTNAAAPDHVYVLPSSYTANNTALVDAADSAAVLTPVTPASFSALSFLAASGAGTVTIDFVIHHADGSTQTGTFTVPDWFNVTPFAFTPRGRVNVDTGGFDAVNSDNPRLYALDVATTNSTSPVTRIELNFSDGPGHAAFLAVSGAGGAVRPIFQTQPASVNTFAGTAVQFNASTSGTAPINFQWQKESNGTFTNVTDVGNVTGSGSNTLALSNVTFANAGAYRLIASNMGGSSTSVVARLNVLSSAPDITSPADEITSFGGSSPENESVANAIDDTTSKYLNFGTDDDTAPPFVGPVGLTVTPASGPAIVSALRIYTANDVAGRDPADFVLEGSNDGGVTFSEVASGPLSLPDARNAAGQPLDPLTQANQEIRFPANNAAFQTYRLTFNNVKDNAAVNSMQIGEIELLGQPGTPGPQVAITENADGTITITWTGGGTLQTTSELENGDTQWTDVAGTSPVTLPITGAQQFFRVVQ